MSAFLTLLSYFNTVGSKEGWTPKTFVSSRSNRKTDTTQRAEDFMDEEDKAAAAEARELETVQSFATIGRVGETQNDAFFGMFVTEEETMGVKIAQKMGWRRDQGIGRKIKRTARLDEGRTEDSSGHLFAPEDSRMMQVAQEDVNRKGLGYQSESRLGATAEKESVQRPMLALPFLEGSKGHAPKKLASMKSSFGVGVLNDTGSDDEDPYELGPKITLNRTLGKEKKPKKLSKFAKAGAGEKHTFVSKRLPSRAIGAPLRTHDGRPPLAGFVLGTQPVALPSKRKYPPPRIPPEWKSTKASTATTNVQEPLSVADAAKASTLDARARSTLLGETPLPGKSVFDFMSKEARDKIAMLTGKMDLPQGLGQAAPDGQQPSSKAQAKDLWSFVPVLGKDVAAAALAKGATGWMPYAEDLNKRARYVGFLELRAGRKTTLPERVDGMPVSDWAKELQEFAHAAQVFKPTTGIMASRFTSSASPIQPGNEENAGGDSLLRQPAAKPEDPAEQAAKLGMYGPMTRSSFPFYPSRLLCKRFNVKPPPDVPHGDDVDPGTYNSRGRVEEPVSKLAMDKMMQEVLSRGSPNLKRPDWMNAATQEPAPAEAATAPTPPIGHATVNVEQNDALAQERASEDIFKAIFGDSDDDEDEE
jgi:G patch domain-containing protein 1